MIHALNKPAPGNAGIASRLTVGHQWPGVPAPPFPPFSAKRNSGTAQLTLYFAQHDHAVRSAKGKAVLQRDLDVLLKRLAEDEVQRAIGIGIIQIA